ncbi:MAG: VTT domain-containing protein [Promethearchaeia archaeon]
MKIKKVDIIFLIIIGILILITVDLLLVEEHQNIVTGLWNQEEFKSEEFFARLGVVFVACIIGNLLPVPTPYSWFVCFGFSYISESIFIPLLFGFVAALGCLIGEMGGYIVGRGAAEVISEERAKNLSKYQEYLTEHPKLAPFLIFLFGLTPLNDDMLTVPLGLIKYSAKKTIVWMWLGKLGMMLIMAYNILGICGLLGGESWELSLATLFLIVIMIYVMVRVDIVKKVKSKIDSDNKE